MRYLYICIFIAAMPIPLAIIEWLFGVTGSGLSIFDSRGPGQVTLLVAILLMVMAYVRFVAKVPPFDLLFVYLRDWRRALAGFGAMLAFASAIVLCGYLVFGALGAVSLSQEGVANLSLKVAERTLVALLVVIVLALTEEILFRVFLMRYLRWSTAPLVTIAAVVFSSFVFAASHNLTDPLEWLTPQQFPLFVGLFILGVLLCTTYLATGSFLCAVGVHAGLLGSKVFLRKTDLVTVDPSAVFLQDTYDLRMSPIVWALFAGMALAIFLARRWLYARYSIERPVVSDAKN